MKAPAKKPAAKKVVAKKVAVKTPAAKTVVRPTEYTMPVEVREWIERAQSTMSHLRSEVERLKTENSDLKKYRTFAEHRILRSEQE
jgi:hypothetical protein